jgi:nucleolar protein 15
MFSFKNIISGPEWDSSDEEAEAPVKAKTTDKTKKTTKQPSKKGDKKAKTETKEDETEKDASVLYIGHLPSEFEERDLTNFLQQFGKVVNIRISRSVHTGNSRGYAFVRWEDAETARVVADTLQGYFVGQRRLVCHAVPNPHKSMFYNTDKVIQRNQLKLKVDEKKRERKLANAGKIKEITARLVQRERTKRAKLEALGIDYDFPGYEASQMHGDEDEPVEDKMDVQESSSELNDNKEEAPQSDKKGKKKGKDSVDIIGSASSPSLRSASSPSLRKRKDSVGSESSATKKAKRKDSVGSEASPGNANSGKKKSKKTIAMEEDSADKTPTKPTKKEVQSEKKANKSKKNKTRRESVP